MAPRKFGSRAHYFSGKLQIDEHHSLHPTEKTLKILRGLDQLNPEVVLGYGLSLLGLFPLFVIVVTTDVMSYTKVDSGQHRRFSS